MSLPLTDAFPAEAAEFVRLRPLLDRDMTLDDFLREVGRCLEPGGEVVRRDERLGFERGNLAWRVRSTPKFESPYLTADEAADYCRVALQTLYNHRAAGRLTPLPGAGKLLFTREELDRWLKTKPGFKRKRRGSAI